MAPGSSRNDALLTGHLSEWTLLGPVRKRADTESFSGSVRACLFVLTACRDEIIRSELAHLPASSITFLLLVRQRGRLNPREPDSS
jgi:hypothetical protein